MTTKTTTFPSILQSAENTRRRIEQSAMKAILYVMTNQIGKVKTFRIETIQQNESDSTNLELFAPDQLRGNAAARLRGLIASGYSLSNWHVITCA